MDDLPGNSKTVKKTVVKQGAPPPPEEKPKQDQIVSGVRVRKKPLGRRFMETFFGGSDARSVWGYVTHEVLIPAAKDMIADAGSQAIERTLFGDSSPRTINRRGSHRSNNAGRVDYGGASRTTIRRDPREESRPSLNATSGRHSLDDIIFRSRAEANEILHKMFQIIQEYEVVSENDLLEMVGLTGDYVRENWGWDDLSGSSVRRGGGGYVLILPRSQPLK